MSFAPAIAPGTQTAQGGSYATWQAVPGTYTISSTITEGSGSSYILQTACVARGGNPAIPSGLSQAIGANQTVTYDLLYTLGTPWSRAQGGDVIVCRDISSTIPALANPNPSFVLPGAGGYPGIVSYGTSYNFDGTGPGGGRSSVSLTNWLAQEAPPSVCDTSKMNFYQFFANKMDIAGIEPLPNPFGVKTKQDFPNEVNLVDGDVTLGGSPGSWVLGEGEKKIIFVNGNARIQTNITYESNNAFFAFIVNGDITIEPSVGTPPSSSTPSLRGLYVTSPQGLFITGQSIIPGREKLVVQGTVIAGGFTLQRDLDALGRNQDTPAEEFIYDPHILLTMPEKFKDLKIKWEEVAP
jgi:hypothetical protein